MELSFSISEIITIIVPTFTKIASPSGFAAISSEAFKVLKNR